MVNVMSSFGIYLHEVNIYKLPNGVFAAELVLGNDEHTHVVDSRSSDAIALAIRVGAPIYTTPEVLDEAGFEPGDSGARPQRSEKGKTSSRPQPTASFKSDMSLKSKNCRQTCNVPLKPRITRKRPKSKKRLTEENKNLDNILTQTDQSPEETAYSG